MATAGSHDRTGRGPWLTPPRQGPGHGHSHGPGHSHSHSHSHGHGQSNDPGGDESAVRPHSMAVRAAFIHALGDLFQSVGVMVAAGLIWSAAQPPPC